jgi:hypothetical protein
MFHTRRLLQAAKRLKQESSRRDKYFGGKMTRRRKAAARVAAENRKQLLQRRKEVQKWNSGSLTEEEVRAVLKGEKVKGSGRHPSVKHKQEDIKNKILSLKQSGLIVLPKKIAKQLKELDVSEKDVSCLTWHRVPVNHDLDRLRRYAAQHGRDGVYRTLYHGTRIENIESIIRDGFKIRSQCGLLGSGVYFGKIEKASSFSDLFVLEVAIVLGRCKRLVDIEKIHSSGNAQYDSLYLPKGKYEQVFGGMLHNEEWVVRDPNMTEVVAVLKKQDRMWL